MSSDTDHSPRTYGGWRVDRPAGLGKFTMGQTLALFATASALVIVNLILGLGWTLGLGLVAAIIALIAVMRDKYGMSIFDKRREKRVFKKSVRRKTNLFRTGLLSIIKGSDCQVRLPGVLGLVRISDHRDSWDRPFTVVHHADGTLTVVMAVSPAGESLVDPDKIERKVALWGRLFEDAANETGIDMVTLTLETSPYSGNRLRREVTSQVSDQAPQLSRQVIGEVVDAASGSGVQARTWLTLTFNPKLMSATGRGREKRALQDISSRLPGLTQLIVESGDGAVHLLTRGELVRLVREAWDPESSLVFERAATSGQEIDLDWSQAGPVSYNSQWDHVTHDSGMSASWVLSRPPQGTVHATVLRKVLAPHPDVPIKRATFLYRPLEPAKAPDVVERSVDKAVNQRAMSSRPSQRHEREVNQALQTAAEEADGAAVVDFSVILTATVPYGPEVHERLVVAAAAMEAGAAGSHLLMRKAYGCQDAALCMGLPLGVMPHGVRLDGRW